MTVFHGFNALMGVAKETTPGTEILVTQKKRLVSATLEASYQPILNDALLGAASQAPSDQGLLTPGGQIVYDMDVGLRDFLIEQFMGTYADGKASVNLTVDTNPTNGDTMTLGAKTYTFETTLTDVDGNIQIGGSTAATQANIVAAINLTGTPGTDYAASMTIHPTVTAAAFAANVAAITAKTGGTAGNSIVSTETFTAGTNVFSAATLTGGTIITYTLDDTADAKSLTVAFDKEARLFAYTYFKPSQMVITGGPGLPLRVTMDGFATGEVLDSSTNTAAALAALSEPGARYLFHHLSGACLVGDLADALAGGDNVKINSFTLTVNRGQLQYHTQSQAPEESLENAFQVVMLELGFPIYQNTDLFKDFHDAHTALQAQLTFTNGSNTRIFRLPNLRTMGFPVPIAGPGLQGYTVTLASYNDLAGANGNMSFAQALQIEET